MVILSAQACVHFFYFHYFCASKMKEREDLYFSIRYFFDEIVFLIHRLSAKVGTILTAVFSGFYFHSSMEIFFYSFSRSFYIQFFFSFCFNGWIEISKCNEGVNVCEFLGLLCMRYVMGTSIDLWKNGKFYKKLLSRPEIFKDLKFGDANS